jgi:hypothetical protein
VIFINEQCLTDSGTRVDYSPSSTFIFSRPPPSRQTLLRSLPPGPSSNILPLLDWGNPPTKLENLGLSGLGEFVSGINSPKPTLLAAQLAPLKRRRPITEGSQGPVSILIKKPRFSLSTSISSKYTSPAASRNAHAATLSALRSKSSTKKHGSVRLRLGLTKRSNIGSKLAQNQSSDESYDVSVQVKLTPRRRLRANPTSSLRAESSGVIDSPNGALTFGLPVPDKSISSSRSEKIQIHLPVEFAASGTPQQSQLPSAPQLSSSASEKARFKGTVLVPASPSPLTGRIAEAPSASFAQDDSWLPSCADTTILSDSVSELSSPAPPHNTTSSKMKFLPSFHGPPLSSSLTKALGYQRSLPTNSCDVTPDILVSASLSLSLEESGHELPVRNGRTNSAPSK